MFFSRFQVFFLSSLLLHAGSPTVDLNDSPGTYEHFMRSAMMDEVLAAETRTYATQGIVPVRKWYDQYKAQHPELCAQEKRVTFKDLKEIAEVFFNSDESSSIFPNYFLYIPQDSALKFIHHSVASVIKRVKIPYVDFTNPQPFHGRPNIKNFGFFTELEAFIQESDPGAKVYISGGMVRSILAYIYKKLYNAHQRALAMNDAEVNLTELVLHTLSCIINGVSQKDADVTKELEMLTVFGIGNNVDIFVTFSNTFKGDRKHVIDRANFLANQLEKVLPSLPDDAQAVKKFILPIVTVSKLDEDRTNGQSSLDLLAFPVTMKSGYEMVRTRNYHKSIMRYFLAGKVNFVNENDQAVPDHLTIRAVRLLVEIPFLTYMTEDAETIKKNLHALIAKGKLDSSAQDEVKRMIQNARFEGAKNRFSTSGHPVKPDSIEGLFRKLGKKHASAQVPEFILSVPPALRRGEDRGSFSSSGLLMSPDDFLANHTDNGVLYHGTGDVTNFIMMHRNGLLMSKNDQGRAIYGQGGYVTKKKSLAAGYINNTGSIAKLKVQPQGLRILDWPTAKENAELNRIFPNARNAKGAVLDAIFAQLTTNYHIDVIINKHVLIQNAASVKFTQKNNDLIVSQIQEALESLAYFKQNNYSGCINRFYITQWYTYLHPQGTFRRFSDVLGVKIKMGTTENMESALLLFLQSDQADENLAYTMILSKAQYFWDTTRQGPNLFAEALKIYKDFIERTSTQKLLSDTIPECIIYLKNAGFSIEGDDLKAICTQLVTYNNTDQAAQDGLKDIIELVVDIKLAGINISCPDLKRLVRIFAEQANKSRLIVGFILKLKDAGMNIDIRELLHWTNKLVSIYDRIKEDMQGILQLESSALNQAIHYLITKINLNEHDRLSEQYYPATNHWLESTIEQQRP